MSFCTSAMVAANMDVNPPMYAMTCMASCDMENIAYNLATMNTPAATMVAACMSAETGVRPSMASGSHTCSGNWADFPTAPQNKSSAIMVIMPGSMAPDWTNAITFMKSNVPDQKVKSSMPRRKPKSPTLFTIKAFFAASEASGFVYQKPIKRYEHTPTNSQNM